MNIDLTIAILSLFLGLIMFAMVLVSTERKSLYFQIPAIVGICSVLLHVTHFVVAGYIFGGLIFYVVTHIQRMKSK